MCASSPSAFDNSRYEQACDQAIAMCDGNMRSTIKALIMANEYLEMELLELQVAISTGCMPQTTQSNQTQQVVVFNDQHDGPSRLGETHTETPPLYLISTGPCIRSRGASCNCRSGSTAH